MPLMTFPRRSLSVLATRAAVNRNRMNPLCPLASRLVLGVAALQFNEAGISLFQQVRLRTLADRLLNVAVVVVDGPNVCGRWKIKASSGNLHCHR